MKKNKLTNEELWAAGRLDELYKAVQPLLTVFCKKYGDQNEDYDDLLSLASIGFMRATKTFKPESSGFASYLEWEVRRFLYHDRRDKGAAKRMGINVSINEPISLSEGKDIYLGDMLSDSSESIESDFIANAVLSDLLEISKKVNQYAPQIISLRLDGLTQMQIVSALGISQVQISRILAKVYAIACKQGLIIGNESCRLEKGSLERTKKQVEALLLKGYSNTQILGEVTVKIATVKAVRSKLEKEGRIARIKRNKEEHIAYIKELLIAGHSREVIAQKTGLSYNTIAHYLCQAVSELRLIDVHIEVGVGISEKAKVEFEKVTQIANLLKSGVSHMEIHTALGLGRNEYAKLCHKAKIELRKEGFDTRVIVSFKEHRTA